MKFNKKFLDAQSHLQVNHVTRDDGSIQQGKYYVSVEVTTVTKDLSEKEADKLKRELNKGIKNLFK